MASRTSIKLVETDVNVSTGSALDRYWKSKGITNYVEKIRPGARTQILSALKEFDEVPRVFNLDAIGYGNWVTQEDRFNYSVAMHLALQDLQAVLKFPSNDLGKTLLKVTFGARGVPRALAHYEPGNFLINVSRYSSDSTIPKATRFLYSGGMGAFAHEYGHFLDYLFGLKCEPGINPCLTEGDSTASVEYFPKYNPKIQPLRHQMSKVIEAIIFSDVKKRKISPYYRMLKNKVGEKPYFFQHNELFARAFESFVHAKCKELKINNRFLTNYKYENYLYVQGNQATKVNAQISTIISMLRKYR
jgi:hypothetical protein